MDHVGGWRRRWGGHDDTVGSAGEKLVRGIRSQLNKQPIRRTRQSGPGGREQVEKFVREAPKVGAACGRCREGWHQKQAETSQLEHAWQQGQAGTRFGSKKKQGQAGRGKAW